MGESVPQEKGLVRGCAGNGKMWGNWIFTRKMDHHSQAGFMISLAKTKSNIFCIYQCCLKLFKCQSHIARAIAHGAHLLYSRWTQRNRMDEANPVAMMPDFPCWHCNSLVGRALHPTCLHAPRMYISGRFHWGLSQFTWNRGSMFISVSNNKLSFVFQYPN